MPDRDLFQIWCSGRKEGSSQAWQGIPTPASLCRLTCSNDFSRYRVQAEPRKWLLQSSALRVPLSPPFNMIHQSFPLPVYTPYNVELVLREPALS